MINRFYTIRSNWHSLPGLNRLLCWIGRHDYEFEEVEQDGTGVLCCFYCGHTKRSYLHTGADLEGLVESIRSDLIECSNSVDELEVRIGELEADELPEMLQKRVEMIEDTVVRNDGILINSRPIGPMIYDRIKDDLIHSAAQAEEMFTEDELEQHSKDIDQIKARASKLGYDLSWSAINQAWIIVRRFDDKLVGVKNTLAAVSDYLDEQT